MTLVDDFRQEAVGASRPPGFVHVSVAAWERLLAKVEKMEAALTTVAANRCLTGWGEPGLRNPPKCACAVCVARAALDREDAE